ncbi:MAG: rod shape-determining protein RodA [Chloroflexi bacterium]|nr:rod shape-determining protein RodA [Chloroflexota bacterium]
MIRRQWRQFDWILLLAVLIVSLYGMVMIQSAVQGDPQLATYPQRQLGFILVGLVLMFIVAAFDYRSLGSIYVPLYVIVIALLAMTGILGKSLFGAQSWIEVFGLFPIQPSELAKIAMTIALGRYLATHQETIGQLGTLVGGLVIMAPLVVLVFMEPDLGTAIVLAVEGGIIFLVAGLTLRHILSAGVVGALSAPLLWSLMRAHQRNRILIFLDPTADPDSFFNVQQALVSVGSGGWLGKGYGQGTQSQLHFLRVRHTDFIFSVVAEEMGFVGAVLLLLLLLVVMMRLWRIAAQAPDAFGQLLVAGGAGIILFQTVVNVGMNMGLLPVTGLPLPFFSYGGNAYFSLMIFLGLAQSVAMTKRSQVL